MKKLDYELPKLSTAECDYAIVTWPGIGKILYFRDDPVAFYHTSVENHAPQFSKWVGEDWRDFAVELELFFKVACISDEIEAGRIHVRRLS